MIYDASNEVDIERARVKLQFLISKNKKFELKEIFKQRTPKQNRYLHLILSKFALEYGERLEYVKLYFFKEMINPDIFKFDHINRVTGEVRKAYYSTSDPVITIKLMTLAIDRFRDFSSKEAGIYLPEPSDLNYLDQIKNEIEQYKQYL